MVDASPMMSAARLSRAIDKQTGVPQGSFSLYYGSRPMYGTLAESGVASGSTIELKSRGRGGGSEPPATSSSEAEINEIEPEPSSLGRQTSGSVAAEPTLRDALMKLGSKMAEKVLSGLKDDGILDVRPRSLPTSPLPLHRLQFFAVPHLEGILAAL